MASKAEKTIAPKRRAIVYFEDSPNGILLRAEDNKADIQEINQWLRTQISLPDGKFYEFGVFVIPKNEWTEERYARLCADFEIKPLAEAHGWTGRLDKTALLERALEGLGLEYAIDALKGRMTVFLE